MKEVLQYWLVATMEGSMTVKIHIAKSRYYKLIEIESADGTKVRFQYFPIYFNQVLQDAVESFETVVLVLQTLFHSYWRVILREIQPSSLNPADYTPCIRLKVELYILLIQLKLLEKFQSGWVFRFGDFTLDLQIHSILPLIFDCFRVEMQNLPILILKLTKAYLIVLTILLDHITQLLAISCMCSLQD